MFTAHAPTFFHRALKRHQSHDVVTALKQGERRTEINRIDHEGMSALQIAAREGLVEALLWLVYAGANIEAAQTSPGVVPAQNTPLYLALLHRQWLCAQILLSVGASKNNCFALADQHNDSAAYHAIQALQLDPRVFRGLLHWAVQHYHPLYETHLLNLLRTQTITHSPIHHAIDIDDDEKMPSRSQPLLSQTVAIPLEHNITLDDLREDLSGLAELAMKNNAPELVRCLMRMNHGYIRRDSTVATVAYWEAQSQAADVYWQVQSQSTVIYQEYMQTDDELIAITLQQLSTAGQDCVFAHSFTKATDRQQQLFYYLETPSCEREALSPRQEKLYQGMKFCKAAVCECLIKDQDCREVLAYLVSKHNFVGLAFAMNYLPMAFFINHAVDSQNSELLFRLMFISDHFPYELLQKIPQKINVPLPALLELLPDEERRGLLYRLVARGVSGVLRDDRSRVEIAHQHALFKAMHIDEQMYLSAYVKRLYPKQIRYADSALPPHLPFEEGDRAIDYAARFGIRLTEQSALASANHTNPLLKLMTDFRLSPSQIVLGYLDEKSQTQFFASCKKSFRFQKNTPINNINRFLGALDAELNGQSYWRERRSEMIQLIICLSLWLVFIASLVKYFANAHDIEQTVAEVRATPYALDPQQHCDIFLQNERSCTSNRGNASNCDDLCARLSHFNLVEELLFSLGLLTPGMFSLFTLPAVCDLLLSLCESASERLRRFDQLPLTDFSTELQQQASQLFNELRDSELMPAFTLTLTTPIHDIRTGLAMVKQRYHNADSALGALADSEPSEEQSQRFSL